MLLISKSYKATESTRTAVKYNYLSFFQSCSRLEHALYVHTSGPNPKNEKEKKEFE